MEKLESQKKIKDFIYKKMNEADQNYFECAEISERLHWITVRRSYAEILNNFLNDDSHLTESQLLQAKAYLQAKSFDQAILQARIAKQSNRKLSSQMKDKLNLLIVRCMVEKGKYLDARQILAEQEYALSQSLHCQKDYYDLLVDIMVKVHDEEKSYEALGKLSEIIKNIYGDRSIEYGMFFVKKGKAKGHFEKYNEAVKEIEAGIQIMIEKKWKQKQKIADIYLTLASFYRKSSKWDQEYTALICAQAMIRQLPSNEKSLIRVIHMLVGNLEQRQQIQKAICELKKVQILEKQVYGESSIQISKTIKKIIRLLVETDDTKDIKKYEQEYRRIMGILGEEKQKLHEITQNY